MLAMAQDLGFHSLLRGSAAYSPLLRQAQDIEDLFQTGFPRDQVIKVKVTYFKKQEGMEVPVPKQAVKITLAESLSKLFWSTFSHQRFLSPCVSVSQKLLFLQNHWTKVCISSLRKRKFAHNGEG